MFWNAIRVVDMSDIAGFGLGDVLTLLICFRHVWYYMKNWFCSGITVCGPSDLQPDGEKEILCRLSFISDRMKSW